MTEDQAQAWADAHLHAALWLLDYGPEGGFKLPPTEVVVPMIYRSFDTAMVDVRRLMRKFDWRLVILYMRGGVPFLTVRPNKPNGGVHYKLYPIEPPFKLPPV